MTVFSISVPVGGYHDLLPTCLASLASQGEGLEISLLDASGDSRVEALCDRYEGLFAYRRHGPDGGQSAAIVEGWTKTEGDILGWLNADDFLFPDAIRKVRSVFEADATADVVAGHSAVCDQAGRMTGYHWAVAPPGENLRTGCVISQPSCFFRRRAYDAAGGLDESLHYTMDWDLWLRLLDCGARFQFVDEVLSVVYWGEGTKTLGMKPPRRRELLRLIDRYTPPGRRFRAKRGFFLRAMLDQLRPPAFSRALERFARRQAPFVFGVGPQGMLAPQATLYLTHFDPEPHKSLSIKVEGAAAANIFETRPDATVERHSDEFVVRFNEAAATASIATVRLRRRPDARVRLVRCEWR